MKIEDVKFQNMTQQSKSSLSLEIQKEGPRVKPRGPKIPKYQDFSTDEEFWNRVLKTFTRMYPANSKR